MSGITYEDVETAIDYLLKNNINPTVDNVRQYLGTGSRTTIHKHVKQWKLENDSQFKGVSKEAIELAQLIQKNIDKIVSKKTKKLLLEKDFIIRTLKSRLRGKK